MKKIGVDERFYNDNFGKGVGSGIVVKGEVVYGHDGCSGELGKLKDLRDDEINVYEIYLACQKRRHNCK